MRHIILGFRAGKQRRIIPQGAEHIAAVIQLEGRAVGQRIGLEPPQENAEVRDIVTPLTAANAAHFDRVRRMVKRGMEMFQRLRLPQSWAYTNGRGARGSCAVWLPGAGKIPPRGRANP